MIASFFISTAIDYARNLCPAYCTSTHRAGFDGNIEGAVGEVFAAQRVGSSRNGLHLSMGGDITKCLGQVVCT